MSSIVTDAWQWQTCRVVSLFYLSLIRFVNLRKLLNLSESVYAQRQNGENNINLTGMLWGLNDKIMYSDIQYIFVHFLFSPANNLFWFLWISEQLTVTFRLEELHAKGVCVFISVGVSPARTLQKSKQWMYWAVIFSILKVPLPF